MRILVTPALLLEDIGFGKDLDRMHLLMGL